LRAFVAAIGAGAVLPGKLPDVVRVALLRRHPAAPGIAAISGTIALEAVIEVFFGLAVLVSWMALGAGVSGTMAHIPTVPGAFAIGAGAAIGAATIGAGVFLRGRIAGAVHRFLSGFAVVRSPRDLVVGVLGWKVVAWALRFASVWAFLAAFGIPAGRARRRR
ncbi:MAG TPA: hypothetical protein PKE32_09805, partial [Miltoncostaeaceae bacterium]|nr:hypothetical protein [Miltoncostaeaceae bacterium]